MGIVLACSGTNPDATQVRMDYAGLGDDFYAAPFPSETRRVEGRTSANGFPNVRGDGDVQALIDIANELTGFGTTSTVFFAMSGPLDPSVESDPDPSDAWDAPVLLVDVDAGTDPHPIEVRFREDGGPFGTANLLSVLPLQGRPLAFDARYAAVVRTRVLDASGAPLGVSDAVRELQRGRTPDGMSDAAAADYRHALDALAARGVDDVAGLAVFRTQDPTAELRAAYEAMLAQPLPEVRDLRHVETFDDFCAFEGITSMPTYQHGEPPNTLSGGTFEWTDGEPVLYGHEDARVLITIPRGAMPAEGWPLVVFSRTGAGGDRPLVERGVRAENGGPAIEAGSGPARDFARVGWAGISIDGPHGGMRNTRAPSWGAEQTLVFNILNMAGTRDNVRQSALELALATRMIESLSFDASDCPDTVGEARFDDAQLALFGHSMGATISPLAAAIEPRIRALLLSGAGGSWIENIIHKELPVPVRGGFQSILGVTGAWEIHEHDPSMMLLQWAGESADPPVYASAIRDNGTHVLMMQGIVDHYILPPIANALSLALELDLAGESVDTDPSFEDIRQFTPLRDHLVFSGGEEIALPAAANRDGTTAVVVQHAQDPIEDGHEVVFQLDEPKAAYRCFLETLQRGEPPRVPAPGAACE